MSYANPDSEDLGIEQPAIALFAELGWETLNCYQENFGRSRCLGARRRTKFSSRIACAPRSKS